MSKRTEALDEGDGGDIAIKWWGKRARQSRQARRDLGESGAVAYIGGSAQCFPETAVKATDSRLACRFFSVSRRPGNPRTSLLWCL